ASLIDLTEQIVLSERNPDAPMPRGADAAQAEQMLHAGTSMGGARPKATVEDEEGLWLAKFSHPDDRWNHPRVEHAMLTLAKSCGISCVESKIITVGNRDVIAVKRFDRHKTKNGYLRSRMVSALTLLGADDSATTTDEWQKWSYLLLGEELQRAIGRDR